MSAPEPFLIDDPEVSDVVVRRAARAAERSDGRNLVSRISRSSLTRATEREFLRELEMLSRHPFPGVAPMVAVGATPDHRVFVIEHHVDGRPLSEYRGAPGATVARLGMRLAATLDTLHRRGFVHGSLTPESVVVDERSRTPVIVDLAESRLRRLSGTLEGLSREPSASDDVGALGSALADLAGADEGSPGADVSLRLWAILDATTNPDPGDRPSAAELARLLREVVAAGDRSTSGEAGTAPSDLADALSRARTRARRLGLHDRRDDLVEPTDATRTALATVLRDGSYATASARVAAADPDLADE